MDGQADWTIWLLAVAVLALFGWFFWHVGSSMLEAMRRLVSTIQNWPQIRRSMVEAEARSGGRWPLWYRAVRVFLVVAMIALMVLVAWRKFG